MKNLLSILLSLSLILGMGVTNQDYVEAAKSNNSTAQISSRQDNSSQKSSYVRFAKRAKSTKSKSSRKSTTKTKKSTKSKKSTVTKKSKRSTTKTNRKSSSSTKTKKNNSKGYTTDTTQGKIKGNKNSMIYHVPGGASYDKISVNNVVYFDTEQDAINAGYRKAKR